MKLNINFLFASLVLCSCNNNKTAQENIVAEKPQSEVAANTEATQPAGDGIVGNWKLTLEAYDDNGNKILDDEERKKGIKNNYQYRFNPDGSCQIQQVFKGRYEVKTEVDKEKLYVYRNRIVGEEEKDPPPDVYHIITLDKNQLLLLEELGNLVFWVFERTNK
jgi:hypothetical protein